MEVRGGSRGKKSTEKAPIFGFRASKIGSDSMVNLMVDNENETMQFMVEDLCQWLSKIVGQDVQITPDNFFKQLADGVILCRLANAIQEYAVEAAKTDQSKLLGKKIKFKSSALCARDKSKFHARENVSKFLDWCRSHKVPSPMLFESNDIVVGGTDGGREVIICLMNLAKRFSIDYYVPAPESVKVEVATEIENRKKAAEFPETSTRPDRTLSANESYIQASTTGHTSITPSEHSCSGLNEDQQSYPVLTSSTDNHKMEISGKDRESHGNLTTDRSHLRGGETEHDTNKQNRSSATQTVSPPSHATTKSVCVDETRSKVETNTDENPLDSITLSKLTKEESLNDSSAGPSSVNDEIIDNVADTVMYADDGSGETLHDMEQVLLEEDNLFANDSITPKHSFDSAANQKKTTHHHHSPIRRYNTTIAPVDYDCVLSAKEHEKDDENSKRRAQSLSSVPENWVDTKTSTESNQQHPTGAAAAATATTTTDTQHPAAECQSCKSVEASLVCANCARLLRQNESGQYERLSFADDSDFISPELNDSRFATTVDDDLETLKNLCRVLVESGHQNRHPIVKFVCIQIGNRYIFVKKVKGQMYVRYNRKWVPLHGLIQDIDDCKLGGRSCDGNQQS